MDVRCTSISTAFHRDRNGSVPLFESLATGWTSTETHEQRTSRWTEDVETNRGRRAVASGSSWLYPRDIRKPNFQESGEIRTSPGLYQGWLHQPRIQWYVDSWLVVEASGRMTIKQKQLNKKLTWWIFRNSYLRAQQLRRLYSPLIKPTWRGSAVTRRPGQYISQLETSAKMSAKNLLPMRQCCLAISPYASLSALQRSIALRNHISSFTTVWKRFSNLW